MTKQSSIGQKLGEWRKEKGLTLQKLAEMTDLSAGYISQIENDKSSPSISTLRSLAETLGMHVIDFFSDELLDDPIVLEEDQWVRVQRPGWDSDSRQMVRVLGFKKMQPFFTTIPPKGKSHVTYSHPGEEFGFVLEGELTIIVSGVEYQVGPMKGFYHSSLLPHSWVNNGEKPCKLIWVVSPPSW